MSTKHPLSALLGEADTIQRNFFVNLIVWNSDYDQQAIEKMTGKNRKIKSKKFNADTINRIKGLCAIWANYREIAWVLRIHQRTLYRRRQLEPELDLLIQRWESLNSIYHKMNIVQACQWGKKSNLSFKVWRYAEKKRIEHETLKCPHCTLHYEGEENRIMMKWIKKCIKEINISSKIDNSPKVDSSLNSDALIKQIQKIKKTSTQNRNS